MSSKDYTVSIHYDRRLYRQDIVGSIAHARMLGRCGIIADDEAEAIVKGLEEIRAEIEGGSFPWKPELEDIHMNVEARLKELKQHIDDEARDGTITPELIEEYRKVREGLRHWR